jgi:drug/metabolite transporter (DMT)-like permease
MLIGIVLELISVVLTVFNAVIIKWFQANKNLPTNLVLIRGLLQLLIFGVAVQQGEQSFLPARTRHRLFVITRGVLTGVFFISNIAALRFLPLGDVFTILSAESLVCILFFLILALFTKADPTLCFTKSCLLLVASLGLYLFLNKYNEEHTAEEDNASPFLVWSYPLFLESSFTETALTMGLIMLFLNLVVWIPILLLTKKCNNELSPSVISFWSGAGGLAVGVIASFIDSRSSVFSGSYTGHEFLVMFIISLSFFVVALLEDQATHFIKPPVLSLIRALQIPVAYLLCPNLLQMPDFYSTTGIILIVICGQLGNCLEFTELQQEEMLRNLYEEI